MRKRNNKSNGTNGNRKYQPSARSGNKSNPGLNGSKPRNRGARGTQEESNLSVTKVVELSLLATPVGTTLRRTPYQLSNDWAVPPVILRQLMPMAAFRGGFRQGNEGPADDTAVSQINWDYEGVDGTSLFTPQPGMKATLDAMDLEASTPIADMFIRRVWPAYDRAFRTSEKTLGTLVTFNDFTAVTCLTTELQSLILDVQNYVQLANGIGNQLWDDMATLFGDVYYLLQKQVLTRIHSAAEVAGGLPAMRGWVHEVCRMKSPFVHFAGRGTLTVPVEVILTDIAPSRTNRSSAILDILTRIELILAILRGEYADVIGAMKRHMPYTLETAGFLAQMQSFNDPIKSAGASNSDTVPRNISGNNGDLQDTLVYRMNEEAAMVGFLEPGASITQDDYVEAGYEMLRYFHTFQPETVLAIEPLSATLYIRDNDAIDKDFALLSPHLWGGIRLLDTNVSAVQMRTHEINKSVLDSYPYLFEATGLQLGTKGSSELYMPEANPATLDVDAVIKVTEALVDVLSDKPQMSTLDVLATTSRAPVVRQEVAQVRNL